MRPVVTSGLNIHRKRQNRRPSAKHRIVDRSSFDKDPAPNKIRPRVGRSGEPTCSQLQR
jgi:hypothetical protein